MTGGLSLILTEHARQVMKRRAITFETIVSIVRDPSIIEPHDGKKRYVRDDLCVVIATDKRGFKVVVTILLRVQDQWTDADVRSR